MKELSAFAATVILAMGMSVPSWSAEGHGHSLTESCKSVCPSAKTEHETHKCLDAVPKAKKAEKTFTASECYHAYTEHEKAEKEKGHGHKH